MWPSDICVSVPVLSLLIRYTSNDKLQRNNLEEKKCNSKCAVLIYICNSSHGSYLFVNFKAKYL